MEGATRAVSDCLSRLKSLEDAGRFVRAFVDGASYRARVFEIALHAFFQVLAERKAIGGVLKPLGQMRSANKKHGNIGDIEIIQKAGGLEILEAWDAKYGKPDLREELEEISEKLEDHSETAVVGFVVNTEPEARKEIEERVREIEELHSVKVHILSFEKWVALQAARATGANRAELGKQWVAAFAECLCQMRRDLALIDEPADAWVAALTDHASRWQK